MIRLVNRRRLASLLVLNRLRKPKESSSRPIENWISDCRALPGGVTGRHWTILPWHTGYPNLEFSPIIYNVDCEGLDARKAFSLIRHGAPLYASRTGKGGADKQPQEGSSREEALSSRVAWLLDCGSVCRTHSIPH